MSSKLSEKLHKLSDANVEHIEIDIDYKSGASYKGSIEGVRKAGKGIFTWPDGSQYIGEFLNDHRHGKGTQKWSDGTSYEGDFVNDFRHGFGKHIWQAGEEYEGQFSNDHRHGCGVFKWSDGSKYVGRIHMNKRHGYGVYIDIHGNKFEGLYKCDEREGPGVLTYMNGCQDVGLWFRERLTKMCFHLPCAFTMNNHPEFQYFPEEQRLYLCASADICESNQSENQAFTCNNGDVALNSADVAERVTKSASALDNLSSTTIHVYSTPLTRNCVVVWNRTPQLLNMQKHILQFKDLEKEVSFDIKMVLDAKRKKFQSAGSTELASMLLFESVAEGNDATVGEILDAYQAYVDVGDRSGFTPLMMAAVNRHLQIINNLLDHGADVNRLNDEGMTALAMCLVLYYPSASFSTAASTNNQLSSKQDSAKPKSSQSVQSASKQNSTVKRGEAAIEVVENDKSTEGIENINSISKTIANSNSVDNLTAGYFDEFGSHLSVKSLNTYVNSELVSGYASYLSTNDMVVNKERLRQQNEVTGTARQLAVNKARMSELRLVIELLLRRGADPNISLIPMPPVFFAVKAADVKLVQMLLSKKADVNIRLSDKLGGLTPLHVASALAGAEGVEITRLLLAALADPNARTKPDHSYITNDSMKSKMERREDMSTLDGRTALHIACSRDDNYQEAAGVVRLLLKQGADPNLLCNGHSALSLAIASGNDLAVDEILGIHPNLNVLLPHGVCSALCAAVSTEYENRRSPPDRILLVDKLVAAGADVLMPVPIGPKQIMGTVVDYAFYVHNLDQRIAHAPYHALTPAEREVFNYRRSLQAHLADILRKKAIEQEQRLQQEHQSRSPSPNFIYTKLNGADISSNAKIRNSRAYISSADISTLMDKSVRKPAFVYCYECGRSVQVHLQPCSRCKAVYFCSKTCKVKAWTSRHKDECLRLCGRSPSQEKADSASKKTLQQARSATDLQQIGQLTRCESRIRSENIGSSTITNSNSKPFLDGQHISKASKLSSTKTALASASVPNLKVASKQSRSSQSGIETAGRLEQKPTLDSKSFPWVPSKMSSNKKFTISNYSLV